MLIRTVPVVTDCVVAPDPGCRVAVAEGNGLGEGESAGVAVVVVVTEAVAVPVAVPVAAPVEVAVALAVAVAAAMVVGDGAESASPVDGKAVAATSTTRRTNGAMRVMSRGNDMGSE